VFAELAGHEGGCGGVDEVLGLILHPLLVVELDILLVFAASTVSLSHRGRVVSQVGVAVVAEIFWHGGARLLTSEIEKVEWLDDGLIQSNS